MWDLRNTNSRELFKVLGTTGGPPGSRSRHLGIKRPMLTIILYSLDSENPIFIGFCVQCVPWLSRNVRDEIRDFPTRSWRPRFNNGQSVARGLKEGCIWSDWSGGVGIIRESKKICPVVSDSSGGVGMVCGMECGISEQSVQLRIALAHVRSCNETLKRSQYLLWRSLHCDEKVSGTIRL
jgi:hypothetical protein